MKSTHKHAGCDAGFKRGGGHGLEDIQEADLLMPFSTAVHLLFLKLCNSISLMVIICIIIVILMLQAQWYKCDQLLCQLFSQISAYLMLIHI